MFNSLNSNVFAEFFYSRFKEKFCISGQNIDNFGVSFSPNSLLFVSTKLLCWTRLFLELIEKKFSRLFINLHHVVPNLTRFRWSATRELSTVPLKVSSFTSVLSTWVKIWNMTKISLKKKIQLYISIFRKPRANSLIFFPLITCHQKTQNQKIFRGRNIYRF